LDIDERGHLFLQLSPQPEAISFLTGGWLERAVFGYLRNLYADGGALNVKLVFPEGNRAEFDAVPIWREKPFLVEATTGNIGDRVTKIIVFHEQLGIPLQNCMVVTSGQPCESNFGSRVTPIWNFPAMMRGKLYTNQIFRSGPGHMRSGQKVPSAQRIFASR
jgi:hypothetical protein